MKPERSSVKTAFQKPKSIKDSSTRWYILTFACVVLIGDAFSFDNPQSLETQLEEAFDINQVEFNLLYSVYSIPNVILPLFGGYLIDRCGVRVNIVLFATLLVLGQIIFTISVIKRMFWLAVIGRLIFGIGSECLTISQTSLVSYWFGYHELSLAVGLNLSVPRLGGALNSYIIPKLYEQNQRLEDPMYFSTVVCFLCSFVCGTALVIIDSKNRPDPNTTTPIKPPSSPDKANISIQSANQLQLSMRSSRSIRPFDNIFEMYPKYGLKAEIKSEIQDDEEEKVNELPPVKSLKRNASMDMAGSYNIDDKIQSRKNLDPKARFVQKEQRKQHDAINTEPSESPGNEEKVLFSQIKQMPKVFWLLLTISSISESLFIPFLNNANKLYQTRFGFSNIRAGEILMVPYIAACLSTPFVGIYMSFQGNNPRAKFIVIATMMFLITHLTFAFLPDCLNECIQAVIPLIMLGICFAGFASVIMPSIPIFINDEKILGTAFGLVAIFQNLLLSLFPLISAQVFEAVEHSSSSKQTKAGFQYVSALFVIASAILVGVGILLYFNWSSEKMKSSRGKVRSVTTVKSNDLQVKRKDDRHSTGPSKIHRLPQNSDEEAKQLSSGGKSQNSLSKVKEKDMFNLEIKELNMKDIFE